MVTHTNYWYFVENIFFIIILQENHSLLLKQSDILRKAAMKISAQSEQHGCYQQVKLISIQRKIFIFVKPFLLFLSCDKKKLSGF